MKYKVVNNSGVKHFNINVGDICTLHKQQSHYAALFYCESWQGDGVWCLKFDAVEIIDNADEFKSLWKNCKSSKI